MLIIPNTDLPAYTEIVVLDNIAYQFGFIWNTRDNSWSMSIENNDELLVASIKIVNGIELINRHKNLNLPQGLIITVNLQNLTHNPNRAELGGVVQLGYVTALEVQNGVIQ